VIVGSMESHGFSPARCRMLLPDVLPFGTFESGALLPVQHARLRLSSCRLDREAGALSRVTVEFRADVGDRPLICRREGPTCAGGDLRLAALATLDAVLETTSASLRFELVGVKPLRAFDTNLIVVGILVHRDGTVTRVVGTAIADDDVLAGVARATLHAVNRLVTPPLTTTDRFAE
jgi:hypothetical protein